MIQTIRVGVCLVVAVLGAACVAPVPNDQTVIRSVAVVDVRDGSVRPSTSVVIESGRITWVGPDDGVAIGRDARVIDGTDRWLIPGLVEAHTHTSGRDALRRALALGVTSALVIHTGSAPVAELEAESRSPGSLMPRLHLVAGRFSAEFPGHLIPGAPRFQAPATPEEAVAAVSALSAEGVKAIKIWQDDAAVWVGNPDMPTFDPEVVEALTVAAQDQGMKVYVHAWDRDLFRAALRLRPDGMLHPVLAPLTAVDGGELAAQRLTWVTTFSLLLEYGDPVEFARRILTDPRLRRGLSDPSVAEYQEALQGDPELYRDVFPALVDRLDDYLDVVAENTRLVRDAGVTLAVGSDATAGYGTHLEIEMMAETGLSPERVLQAATLGGAMFLGAADDIGSIEVGKVADLVLLDADPRIDVKNLRAVRLVLKAGHIVEGG